MNELLPLILKWEGGYVNRILRPHYWNRWRADEIRSQALANILVDWVWGSGKYGITIPQGILGVKQDGIVGKKTLDALNNYPDPEELFHKIWQMRKAYFHLICMKRPANKRFLKGWLNRLNDFKWIAPLLCFCLFLLPACRSASKMEKTEQMLTENIHSQRVSTGQKEREEINERFQLRELDEDLFIDRMTILLDTNSSSLNIKQIELTGIRREQTGKEEKRMENTVSETENTTDKRNVSVKRKQKNEAETKEIPALWKGYYWIAGGALLLLLYRIFRRFF
jgi:hypothetical protein